MTTRTDAERSDEASPPPTADSVTRRTDRAGDDDSQGASLTALQIQRLALAGAIVAIVVVTSQLSDVFLTWNNAANIGRAIAVIGIVSIGQTVVLLTGNIDLAVGSVAALSGVVLALAAPLGMVTAVPLALAVGLVVGLLHGVTRVVTGVSSLVITLATMTAVRGLVLVISDGFPMSLGTDQLTDILWGETLGIPRPIAILALAIGLTALLLALTRFGTYVYAVGGNRLSAEKAGISSARIFILSFMFSGLAAAFGGVMISSRLATASPTAGTGWELETIAAVVIGGASLSGGKGDMAGTVLGVLLIGTISNAMNLLGIDAFFQEIALGILILVAVVLSAWQERRDLGQV